MSCHVDVEIVKCTPEEKLGISLQLLEDRVMVKALIAGAKAEAAGCRVADQIVSICGVRVTCALEAARLLCDSATVIRLRIERHHCTVVEWQLANKSGIFVELS